jgi:hypothetical protein
MFIDVFNGDADGLCALQQLRLQNPRESTLVTGTKRETALLNRITDASHAEITVLDVALRVNRPALDQLLAQNNRVVFVDHHNPGDIPAHPHLEVHIDTDSSVCTSLIVDRLLDGKFHAWALVAAFGDNLQEVGAQLAAVAGFATDETKKLQEMGLLLNYNGYGQRVEDLWFSPAELSLALRPHRDPLAFYAESPVFAKLRAGYASDLQQAKEQPLVRETATVRGVRFPAEPWSHRIVGTFSNQMATEDPQRAQVTLVDNGDNTLLVSLRAPLERPWGADSVCLQFEGGGRSRAAGIKNLPEEELSRFWDAVEAQFAA